MERTEKVIQEGLLQYIQKYVQSQEDFERFWRKKDPTTIDPVLALRANRLLGTNIEEVD